LWIGFPLFRGEIDPTWSKDVRNQEQRMGKTKIRQKPVPSALSSRETYSVSLKLSSLGCRIDFTPAKNGPKVSSWQVIQVKCEWVAKQNVVLMDLNQSVIEKSAKVRKKTHVLFKFTTIVFEEKNHSFSSRAVNQNSRG